MVIEALTLEDVVAAGAPKFAENTSEVWLERLIQKFEQNTNRTIYRGQSEMFMFEAIAYALALRGEDEQAGHENNLVAFAAEPYLVAMGANTGVYQLQASAAQTTLRFTRVDEYQGQIIVPKGTRVAPSSGIVSFETQYDIILDANDLYGDVSALCQNIGVIGNGFAIGQIDNLQDAIVGIESVSNISETGEGSNIEDIERLRYRMANASERISNAGPAEGYIQDILDVSPAIVDCHVDSPDPCYIDIYLLMAHGHANEEEKAAVMAKLDAESGRPMGDRVAIKELAERNEAIDLIIYFSGDATSIKEQAIIAANHVLSKWSQSLGGYIAPLAITSAVKQIPGVIHSEIPDLFYEELPQTTFRNFILNEPEMRMSSPY